MGTKRCYRCQEEKLITEFGQNRTTPDGLQYDCKSCRREIKRKYQKEHPEKSREYMRRYNRAHPHKMREYRREYYQKHKEAILEYHKKYWEEHKEEHRERNRKCRRNHAVVSLISTQTTIQTQEVGRMNRKQRAKRSQERNERDWQRIEPLIMCAVNQVWRNMSDILQSRFPKHDLVNCLWLAKDWAAYLNGYDGTEGQLLDYMNIHLWDYMGHTEGGSSNDTPVMNRKLSDGDEEMVEDVYHNAYRAEPADPADIVADKDLLKYIMGKLTKEEKEILAEFLGKNETLAVISKRRRHLCGYSKNMIRAKVNCVLTKVRRLAIEQGWNK